MVAKFQNAPIGVKSTFYRVIEINPSLLAKSVETKYLEFNSTRKDQQVKVLTKHSVHHHLIELTYAISHHPTLTHL
jgi:hypothetical protein